MGNSISVNGVLVTETSTHMSATVIVETPDGSFTIPRVAVSQRAGKKPLVVFRINPETDFQVFDQTTCQFAIPNDQLKSSIVDSVLKKFSELSSKEEGDASDVT